MKKVYFSIFTYDVKIAFPTAFFMYIFMDYGVDATLLSTMYLVNMVLILLLEYPTGILTDYLGRKRAMILSNVLFAFSYIFVLFVANTIFVIFHFIFTSLAIALRSGSFPSWLQEFSQSTGNHHREFQKFELFGLWGRLLGCIGGFLTYYFTGSYKVSIVVLMMLYCLTTFLFNNLDEHHNASHLNHFSADFSNSLAYFRSDYVKGILLIMNSGSIFLLSLPIYMYYPVNVDLYFEGNRMLCVLGVALMFVAMCLVGLLLTKVTQEFIAKNESNIHRAAVVSGLLLFLASPMMYYSYRTGHNLVILVLPVLCSGFYTILRTLSLSTITNIIKLDKKEQHMSSIMSMYSALGMALFCLYYLLINIFTQKDSFDRFIEHYVLILPIALLSALSVYILSTNHGRTQKVSKKINPNLDANIIK